MKMTYDDDDDDDDDDEEEVVEGLVPIPKRRKLYS